MNLSLFLPFPLPLHPSAPSSVGVYIHTCAHWDLNLKPQTCWEITLPNCLFRYGQGGMRGDSFSSELSLGLSYNLAFKGGSSVPSELAP